MMSKRTLQAAVFTASIGFITYFALSNQSGAENGVSQAVTEQPEPQPTETVPADPVQVTTPEPEVVPPEY